MGTTHHTQPVSTPASYNLRHPSCPETRNLASKCESVGVSFVNHEGHWEDGVYVEQMAFQIWQKVEYFDVVCNYWMVFLQAGIVQRWVRLVTKNGTASDIITDMGAWGGEDGLLDDMKFVVEETRNPA